MASERDWAVDAAEDALLFCAAPVWAEDGTLVRDPTTEMYMLADRIRSHAHLAQAGEVVAPSYWENFTSEMWVTVLNERYGGRSGEALYHRVKLLDYQRKHGFADPAALAHPRPAVPEVSETEATAYETGFNNGYTEGRKYPLQVTGKMIQMALKAKAGSWRIEQMISTEEDEHMDVMRIALTAALHAAPESEVSP